jgi:hypothetical protein
MKTFLISGLSLVAVLLAPTSCTPYPDVPPPAPGPDVAMNPNSQDPAANAAMGESANAIQEMTPTSQDGPRINETVRDPAASETVREPSTPVAKVVPGKPGFVFSPFNKKIIDVKGIPSGTLVQDPTFPASEKKYFRVP